MAKLTRRSFLRSSALVAGAAAGAGLVRSPILLAAGKPPSEKIGVAVIGCGGQGIGAHIPPAAQERLVALVDADERQWSKAKKRASEQGANADDIKTFFDYRKMFDTLQKDIDAVFIATCNHHHFLPSMLAMQLGKGVYVEKPMAHSIEQCRQMAVASQEYEVPTQMGNQGHYGEGTVRCAELLQAGALGKVTEVHSWSDRANGGSGPRPPTLPVPEGLHWDEWIGPSPKRDFHYDLVPHEWHGWYDFGNSSVGNMACHIVDCAVWGLNLKYPTTIEAEAILGGTDERYPVGTRVRMDFPARGDMPPLKFYWWDGLRPGNRSDEALGEWSTVPASGQNRPVLADGLEKKFGRKLGGNGTLYVGEKGYLYTGTYGGESLSSMPDTLIKEISANVPKTLPRPGGGSFGHLIQCVKDKTSATSSRFAIAAVLTEVILLVNLAQRAGVGRKIEWDGPNMKCTNMPELNNLVKLEYRKGWSPA
jgi:predicted dehydrogenase